MVSRRAGAVLANALVVASVVVLPACGGGGTAPSPTLSVTPTSLAMTAVGQTAEIKAVYSTSDSRGFNECSQPFSTNLAVATVASTSGGDSPTVQVRAEDYGTASIRFSCRPTAGGSIDAAVPVTVWPNTTWSGSVTWEGSCLGSDPAYHETVAISVDDKGVGTLTAIDSPGFDRKYAITIPSAPATLTFDSSGVFTYSPPGGASVQASGHITITLQKDTLHYAETTGWGSCSNIYIGDLKRSV